MGSEQGTSSYRSETAWRPKAATPLSECPLALAMDWIGGKWTAPIIWWLGGGSKQFGELRRLLPLVSAKVLTDQLRSLEQCGLVSRTERRVGRVRTVQYDLRPPAVALLPILDRLCEWGASLSSQTARP